MSLLVRLVRSNYYGVIFKILTGQKRDVTELKFLWPVNMTGNSPKFILSPASEVLITRTYTLCVYLFHNCKLFSSIQFGFQSTSKNKSSVLKFLWTRRDLGK